MNGKIFLITIAVILTLSLCACNAGNNTENTVGDTDTAEKISEPVVEQTDTETEISETAIASIANPYVDYDSAESLSDAAGFRVYNFLTDKAVSDTSYSMMSDKFAQIRFSYDGAEYCLRMSKSVPCSELHGVYGAIDVSEDFDGVCLCRCGDTFILMLTEDGIYCTASSDSDTLLRELIDAAEKPEA